MVKIRKLVDSQIFQNVILGVIVLNAILMGLATSSEIMSSPSGVIITTIDYICLGIFVIEVILKIIAYNKDFLRSGWNIFDFIIVAISLVPNLQFFAALRTLRVLKVLRTLRSLRVLRMVSGFKKLRIIATSIIDSIPGILWTGFLLLIEFYVFAILGTTLFAKEFPEWFGSIGSSFYTLFQVMTLESWSMGISRPVMEVYSWAWLYFVPFVICSAFIVMNVVVGIVVNTISETTDKIAAEDMAHAAEIKNKLKERKRKGKLTKAEESELEELEKESDSKEINMAELSVELENLKKQISKIESMIGTGKTEKE